MMTQVKMKKVKKGKCTGNEEVMGDGQGGTGEGEEGKER